METLPTKLALISSRDGINWVRRAVPAGYELGPKLTDSPIGVVGHAVTGLLH